LDVCLTDERSLTTFCGGAFCGGGFFFDIGVSSLSPGARRLEGGPGGRWRAEEEEAAFEAFVKANSSEIVWVGGGPEGRRGVDIEG